MLRPVGDAVVLGEEHVLDIPTDPWQVLAEVAIAHGVRLALRNDFSTSGVFMWVGHGPYDTAGWVAFSLRAARA